MTSVTQTDPTGGAPPQQTAYQYLAARPGTTTTTRWCSPSTAPTGSSAATPTSRTLTGDGVNDPQTEPVDHLLPRHVRRQQLHRGDADRLPGRHPRRRQPARRAAAGDHGLPGRRRAGRPLDDHLVLGVGGGRDPDPDRAAGPDRELRRAGRDLDPAGAHRRRRPPPGGTPRPTPATTPATSDADFGLPRYVYTHTVPGEHRLRPCTTTTYAPANTAENLAGLAAPRPRPTRWPAAGSPRARPRRSRPG